MAGSQLIIEPRDDLLPRFQRHLEAVGQGKARVAMGRAVNAAGAKTNTAVKRALIKQTSIKRSIVEASMSTRKASTSGTGPLEYVIRGKGSEIPLAEFSPRQFKFGVRAKVWGRMQRFNGMFGAPGDNPKVVAALNGQIFHRTGKSRLPIEKSYGPSVPKEMVEGETKATFERVAPQVMEARLFHELKRMLAF